MKSQSAMEYLMTYGWAILIIAVVLAALFQLGVFSGIGTPKAQAGNCQVIKEGSGTTQTISLAGQCQGQEPEYVTVFGPQNGYGDYIYVPISSSLTVQNFTVTGWVYWYGINGPGSSNCQAAFGDWDGAQAKGFEALGVYGCAALYVGNTLGSPAAVYWPTTFPSNKWTFAAVEYNYQTGTMMAVEDSSFKIAQQAPGLNPVQVLPYHIGATYDGQAYFWGMLSNIQFYNTTLSASEVNAIYLSGIGGAPVRPQNLIGWWPLNGNTRDYSGNGNDGAVNTVVTYSNSWTPGYTAP